MLRTHLGAAMICAIAPLAASTQPPPRSAAPTGVGYHGIDLPVAPAAGENKETRTLLESPHLKLASVILRRGTVLEEHSAPVAVTIQALSGSGVVEIGASREAISPGRMVFLAPNTKHAIRPDGTADLVLLIHHLSVRPGRSSEGQPVSRVHIPAAPPSPGAQEPSRSTGASQLKIQSARVAR